MALFWMYWVFLGNIMEKNDKGKIKENKQVAALIVAYRQHGYKL